MSTIDNIRNDTGVYEGSEISIYYDPMISKLCAFGKDRSDALSTMESALNKHFIRGIRNNINFLTAIIRNENFISGDINTEFINTEYPNGYSPRINKEKYALLFSLAGAYLHTIGHFHTRSNDIKDDFYEKTLVINIENYEFEFKTYDKQDNIIIEYKNDIISVDSDHIPGKPITNISINNNNYTFKVEKIINGYSISGYGYSSELKVLSKKASILSKHMISKKTKSNEKLVKCPMPGLVISVDVKEGQEVEVGDKICTIEAMKMENIIRSELSGKIKKIHCKDSDSLSSDQIILEFL